MPIRTIFENRRKAGSTLCLRHAGGVGRHSSAPPTGDVIEVFPERGRITPLGWGVSACVPAPVEA